MSDYFEVEERLREALSYRRAHPKPLYNFSLGSSRWIRIAFTVSPKVKILAIPVLLPIKSLIKIKILHYAGISKASIASAYSFVTKQLPKLPIRFLQLATILTVHHLRSANIGLLAGLNPIRNTQLLKKSQLSLNNSMPWRLKMFANSLNNLSVQRLNTKLMQLIYGI